MNASAATEDRLTIPVETADDRSALGRWRDHGADDRTSAFNLAVRHLGRLIESHRDRAGHVLVACFPKSAGTFLCRVLVHTTGFRSYVLNNVGEDTERNIDVTAVPYFLVQDTVSQEHMRATRNNVRLLRAMGIRPVVLVRDIFDVIVSARDHGLREGIVGPHAHTPAAWLSWNREDRDWFIIRNSLPWFLSFVASWQDAASDLDVLWITWEDVVTRTRTTVETVLQHAGVERPDVDIDGIAAAIDPAEVRFNHGTPGRGRRELTPAQLDAVHAVSSSWKGTYDFSVIGLPAETR